MTAAPDEPQTEAGRQAAEDKAAAAEKIRKQAAEDQAAAADAERRRQQTAAARAAKAATRKPAEPAAAEPVTVDEQPAAAAGGCEECRQSQEILFDRLGRLETQVQAIGKLVATGIIAGAVIWYLSRSRPAAAVPELAAAEPAE